MSGRPVVLAAALVLAGRLSLAPAAGAQEPVEAEPGRTPRQVEIGGSIGAIWIFPTVGLIASVPATDWLSVEGTVNRVAGTILTQGQVRVPLGRHHPTRRSLVAGFSHVSDRGDRFTDGLHAHVGVSFQQAVSRRVDLRADLQMLIPFRDGPDADPRAMIAVVWHPRAGSRGTGIARRAIVAPPAAMANIRRSSG